jgi:hypothetical protein
VHPFVLAPIFLILGAVLLRSSLRLARHDAAPPFGKHQPNIERAAEPGLFALSHLVHGGGGLLLLGGGVVLIIAGVRGSPAARLRRADERRMDGVPSSTKTPPQPK